MKTFRILLAVVCLLASMTTMSQITVGTRQEAHRGALLHLRTTTQDVPRETYDTLGLKLTVVDLPDTSKLYLGDALTYGLDVDKTATGMVVYNRTNDPCSALVPCLYVWDGATWHPAGCPVPECATPLSATYQIDGCVALMYTYQTQKLWVSPTTSVDYGKQKQYKWRERVRINNGAWGAWTTLSTTDSVHVIPPFRFNSPTYSTSDLIEAQYECEVKNAASPAITATLYGGTATITFVHLGTSAEIHAKAAANAGLIPVKLKTGSGASDTLIIAHANLGAELDSINDGITNDACDFGDLYQWGRQKDGHQRVTWRKNSVNEIDIYNPPSPLSSALYNQGTPLIAGDYGVDHQVLNTSAAFGKFIYSSAEVKWTLTAADSEDLWRGDIKTSSDPCPAGWRVMNRDEITKLYNSAPGIQLPWGSASIDTNNTWKQSDANSFTKNWGGGYIVRNNSASDQYAIFVTAGVRDRSTGLIGTAFSDVEGRLWTSSDEEGTSSAASNNLYAHSFAFNKTFFRTDDVNSGGSQFNKVDGRGVRCVKLAESDLCYDSNTTGTEFYVAFGKNHNADNDPTTPNSGLFGDPYLAVDVSAKVNTNVTFTFTYDDSTVVQTVNAGSVYRLEMKDIPTLKKIYPNDTIYTPSDLKKTLKITSGQPISVYAFNTYQSTTDATIVLPTSAWGKSYFTVSYRPEKTPTMNGSNRISYYAHQLIVAKEDGTTVTVFDTDGNIKTAQTLDAGQLYTYIGPSAADITGSSIVADKPIGVFSHTRLSRVPDDRNYADIMYEQMQSVERWGRRFLVPNAKQGANDVGNRIRILASQNGTNITYDGATQIATGVASSNFVASGTVLNAKQFIELEMSPVAGQYCVITSDKPVAVCAYMVGQGNVNAAKGDPSIAWIPALDQMITDALIQPYMFSTDTKVDYTNFDGFLKGGLIADGIYHLATVIVPTTAKSSTKVNGTPLSTLWSGDTWTDDATTGYSFLVHQFDNSTDLGKDFLISNPWGVMALAYGYTNVESYYYNAGCGTCLRGITPAYHGPSCLSSGASNFPAAPTGYTYTWTPSTIGTGTFSVTVTDNSNGLSQTYLNALTVGATTFATPTIGASTSNAITYGSNNVEYWVTSPEAGVTYNWSVPEWMMITSGQGTDRIRVEVPWPAGYSVSDTPPDVTGTVTVTPSNGCSTGTAGTVSVGAKKGI